MSHNKLLKKLKRFIKKEYGVKNIDVRLDDTLITVAERVIMKAENCNLEQAYSMWIEDPKLHLPGWVAVAIASEFCNNMNNINQNSNIRELFDNAVV